MSISARLAALEPDLPSQATGNPEVKIYRALLAQVGEDDPVVTVLENSLGIIRWTRQSAGVYYGVGPSQGFFPVGKTAVLMNTGLGVQAIQQSSQSLLIIDTISEGVPTDGLLLRTFVQILVYP